MANAIPLRLLAALIAAGNLPSSSLRRDAVFIGRVIEVFPRKKETLQSVLAHLPKLAPLDQQPLSLDQQKQLRLQLAQGVLNAVEQRRIIDAKDEAELWNIEFRWWHLRRATVEVLEPFWGINVATLQVLTPMDSGGCGVAFEAGKTYLVEAVRNAVTRAWHVEMCSRTRNVAAAQDDIEALRAWQRGLTLPRRVYGWLPPGENRRLFLRGDDSQYETRSDERGYFRFPDVAPGRYRLEADAPGYDLKWIQLFQPGDEKSPIDLITNRCAELFVSFAQRTPSR